MADENRSSSEDSDFEGEEDVEEGSEGEISESEEEDDEGLPEERESGDGQEQPRESREKLDDDEDRKNPAFVPRRGMFYEHDMRSGDGSRPSADTEDKDKPKKKLWAANDRWTHDKFDPVQQAPKSREELIAEYGYDILAHNQPPEEPPNYVRERGARRPRRPRFGDFMQRGSNHQRSHGPSDAAADYEPQQPAPQSHRESDHYGNSRPSRDGGGRREAQQNSRSDQQQRQGYEQTRARGHQRYGQQRPPRTEQAESPYEYNRHPPQPGNDVRTSDSRPAYRDDDRDFPPLPPRGGFRGRARRAGREYRYSDSRQWVNSKYAKGDYRHWNRTQSHSERPSHDDDVHQLADNVGNMQLEQEYDNTPEDYVEQGDEEDRDQRQRHDQQTRVKRYSTQRQRLPADDVAPMPPPPSHQPVVMTSGYFPPVMYPGGVGNAYASAEQSPGHSKSFSPQHAIVQTPMLYTVPGGPGSAPVGPSPVLYPAATMGPAPSALVNSAGFASPAVISYQPTVPPSHMPPPPMGFIPEQAPPPEPVQIRGGTTYFSPQANAWAQQQQSSRRVKMAIPIVNPQEGGGKKSYEAGRRGDKHHAKERVNRAEQPPPPPHVPSAEAEESQAID